ncbi:hypothetical protein Landi51_12873 [Colletotrichum acutatum]
MARFCCFMTSGQWNDCSSAQQTVPLTSCRCWSFSQPSRILETWPIYFQSSTSTHLVAINDLADAVISPSSSSSVGNSSDAVIEITSSPSDESPSNAVTSNNLADVITADNSSDIVIADNSSDIAITDYQCDAFDIHVSRPPVLMARSVKKVIFIGAYGGESRRN